MVAGGGTDNISGLVIPGTDIDFGAFISAIINFLIVAFVVFLLVKGINKVQDASGKILKKDNGETVVEEPPACPFCKEEVKEGATRCPHCAAELPQAALPVKKTVAEA